MNPLARIAPTVVSPPIDLSVVMPCYNESETIESILREWILCLQSFVGSFELLVINDGSMDGTGRVLDRLRRDFKQIRVIHQLNHGHGRAVRRGYEAARGEYVLQVDPNGRYQTADFLRMWQRREDYLLIVGRRGVSSDPIFRRLLALILRKISNWVFGSRLGDPNVPFRLFRRNALLHLLSRLPAGIDSINLCLTLLMAKLQPHEILELDIPAKARLKGRPGLSLLSLFRSVSHWLSEAIQLRLSLVSFPFFHARSEATN